jgi:hypothetical protein
VTHTGRLSIAVLLFALPEMARADDAHSRITATPDHSVALSYPKDQRVARYPMLDVLVNGHPARMLLDTGASSHMLSEAIVDRLGLKPAGLTSLSDHFGAGSKEDLASGAVISVGDWTFPTGMPLIGVRLGENFGYDGILSPQGLASASVAVVLDLVHGQLTSLRWSDAETQWGGFGVALAGGVRICQQLDGTPSRGFLLPAEIAGEKINLLLDTGADHSNLTVGSALGQKLMPQAKPAGTVHSVVRTEQAFVLPATRMALGSYQSTVALMLVPRRGTWDCAYDGVLGLDVLRNCVIAISGRKLLVQCQPAPEPDPRAMAPGKTGSENTAGPTEPSGKITLASQQAGPNGIAVGGGYVYWTNTVGGQVSRVALAGGKPTVLASGLQRPWGIAVDSTSVYWTTDAQNGLVMQLPLAGGRPKILASGRRFPHQIVVDRSTVYWTEGWARGRVMKLPLGGGTPIVLAAKQDHPCRLAVDSQWVYWRNQFDDPVNSVPIGGGEVRALREEEPYPTAVADSVKLTAPNGNVLKITLDRKLMVALEENSLYFTNGRDGTVLKLTAK